MLVLTISVQHPAQTKCEQLGAFTLKELKAHKPSNHPAVFRPVVARIVDFYPEKPEHFVILRCTKCLSECVSTRPTIHSPLIHIALQHTRTIQSLH